MKVLLKMICVLIIVTLVFIVSLGNNSYASGIGVIITGADGFIQDGASGSSGDTLDETELKAMSDTIYNVLLIVAIIVAVVFGLIIGIRLMTAGATEKAKTKETLIPYIAGCIVIFGAFSIWKLVVNILSET